MRRLTNETIHHWSIWGFDYAKYARDFRQGFYGIEACLFRGDEDISNLLKESRDAGFRVGIHFPLRDTDALRDALFMAQDETVRAREYARVQQALDELTEIAPDYVLFHYPKPVILDDRVNWGAWHFTDSSEYAYESSYPLELFLEQSEALFAWLSEQGRKYKFTPVLELDAINHYVYATDHVTRLLEKYSSIKLCLDTARLYLQDRLDPCFDALGAIRKFARFAGTVHLSNVQIGSNNQIANKRNPVLPTSIRMMAGRRSKLI